MWPHTALSGCGNCLASSQRGNFGGNSAFAVIVVTIESTGHGGNVIDAAPTI